MNGKVAEHLLYYEAGRDRPRDVYPLGERSSQRYRFRQAVAPPIYGLVSVQLT